MDPEELNGGNGPVEGNEPTEGNQDPTSEPTETPPVEGTEPAEGTTPTPAVEPELYQLPDGRMVDEKTALKEFKENFYPEFTRRSMRLSELERAEAGKINNNNQPDYSNLTPEERNARMVIDQLKSELLTQAREEMAPEIEQIKLKSEIQELRTKYPDFDERVILPFAQNKQIWNLEDAYILMNHQKIIEDTKRKIQTAAATENARKQTAGISTGGSAATPPAGLKPFNPETDKNKSIKELYEEGYAQLGLK